MSSPAPPPSALPPHVIRQLAVAAFRDPRTVRAALEGRASKLATAAVYDAAQRLGIALPPSQPLDQAG